MSSGPRELPHDAPDEKPRISLLFQHKLTENVDWIRDLVEHSRDLLCVHDLEGRLLSVNPVPARLLGYTVEEILKIPMPELLDPQFRDQFDSYLGAIARAGQATGTLAVLTRTGERRYWEYHCTLRTEGVEKPVVRGIAHDVTERFEAERSLRETNKILEQNRDDREILLRGLQLFRALLDHSNDAIEVVDPTTLRLLDVNEKCCAELGYTRDELLSMTIYDIVPRLTPERVAENREQLRKTGFTILENVHRRKDGTTFPVEVNLKGVQLDREYLVAISRDITERKLHDQRLREYERVVESLDEMIVVVDRDHRYVLANRAFLRYRGMTKEQVVGRHLTEVLQGDSYEKIVKQKLDESFRGQVIDYEMNFTYPQVGERNLAITYLPVAGPAGIDKVAAVMRDVTERNRAAALLEESEKRFRAVYDRAPVGIALLDVRSGRFLQVNTKLCQIMGRPEHEMLQMPYLDLMCPEDRIQSAERARQLVEGERGAYDIEKRYVRPDGTVVQVSISVVPMWQPGEEQRTIMSIVQDITERRRAEKALQASEADLREAQHVARMGSWRLELPGEKVTGSDQLFRLIGLEPKPAGMPFKELGQFFLPESWQQIAEANRKAIETGRPEEMEVACPRPDGSVAWLLARAKTDTDETGRIVGLRGIAIDITERKSAAEMLRQSNERFRVALSGSPTAVYNQDRDLRYTWVYNLAEGGLPEDYLGKTDEEVFGAEEGSRLRVLKQSVLDSGIGVRQELPLTTRGKQCYFDATIEPLRDSSGKIVGVNCALVDLTRLHQVTEELRQAKEKLTEEKLYLEQEIDTELGFKEIIGQSKTLKAVMESVAKVAASDATVLLLGETGTGKELVARALHRLSHRSGNAFIKMNCAAIPSGLLESELFGNEKGAFTGAVNKKIGRLELADKGTIFLDEIGDISLALQPKLLRVLQDQEFERLGGTQTLKVNFRLIAATNRDLAQSVREKEFRSDLFYRLNVFPIFLPPLRERREDIPLLVEHFIMKISRRLKKHITSVPRKTMDALVGWSWPGNVRELENFLERSLILTTGSVLTVPLGELRLPTADQPHEQTLKAAERRHILNALRESRGQISGPRGAAMRLGLKRTTLQSKLKQLGINPRVPPPAP